MSNIIVYDRCPVCKSISIVKTLVAKDNTVSKALFEIWQCNSCTLRFTQNVPNKNSIGTYYKSEDYISHTDSQSGLINRIYHTARIFTLKLKRKVVETYSPKTNRALLDIGAGTGTLPDICRQKDGK